MVTWDKEDGHYTMIKGPISQEDITNVNIYTLNIRAPTYIKQILTDLKREIGNNTIILWNFNTPISTMDRSARQKINKEMLDLNHTLDQMDIYLYI